MSSSSSQVRGGTRNNYWIYDEATAVFSKVWAADYYERWYDWRAGRYRRVKWSLDDLKEVVNDAGNREVHEIWTWEFDDGLDDGTVPASSATSSEEVDDEVSLRAQKLHNELRKFWNERYDTEYDPKLLHHLSLLLFKKRRLPQAVEGDAAAAPQPGSDYDTAFASEAETGRAILSVLRVRHEFLLRKNITDPYHKLTQDERAELVKHVRNDYEHSTEQLALQHRDAAKGKAKHKSSAKGGRGASQPASKGSKAKGKGRGSPADFVRKQKRKRWHRHLQRVCGTKQIWEVLAFSGRFDIDMLLEAFQQDDLSIGADTEPPAVILAKQETRRRLHHAKAEAIARYKEGARLHRHREELRRSGAEETFTLCQRLLLQRYVSGELLRRRNLAVGELGHGRLRTARGDYLDIGGSTGGGARRVLDSWQPPDWREFIRDDQEEDELED